MTQLKSGLPFATPLDLPHRSRATKAAQEPVTQPIAGLARKTWSHRYRLRLLASDTAIVIAAVAGAYAARFGFAVGGGQLAAMTMYTVLLPLIIVVWMLALAATHTRDERAVGLGLVEYRRVFGASALAFGLLAVVFVAAKVDVSRGFFVLVLPLGTIALLVSRWSWRTWLRRRRLTGGWLSSAIVVGRLDDVRYVIEQLQARTVSAYRVVGVALFDSDDDIRLGTQTVPVVSTSPDTVASAAARLATDAVILAGQPHADGDFVRTLSWQLEGTAAEFVLATRLPDVAGQRIHFRPLQGLPLIEVDIPRFTGGKHVLKRAMDVVVAGMALVLLAPLMLAIALIVRLDSPGPAIYRQERVGRGGRTFKMAKFRSMVVDADCVLPDLLAKNEGCGPLFKLRHDPRITRVGRALRKYSLDELPQLWNVLLGDMSLVGPRPPLEREVDDYTDHVHRRLYLKPGLTGIWQVSGRSNLSWDESVRLDLYYVENWSLTGDLVLLWRTVKVVVRPEGAY